MWQGKLAIQQRVLPAYRAPFFDTLAALCSGGLSVFAGQPLPVEGIAPASVLAEASYTPARNRHFADPSSSLYLCWQEGLLPWLERTQPDALIVEANPRLLTTHRLVAWMHARSRPVLGWGLGAPPLGGPLTFLRRWERLAFLRRLDGWIAYSRRGAQEYRQLGLDPGRVFTAGNAVAPPPQGPPPVRPEGFAGPPVVLFVGRLQRRKRVDLLLQACAALPELLQPRLRIVGDGPHRPEMAALARSIYPSAEFLGAKHGVELEALYRQADLFVLPGTGGLAVQQAMTHALPVIVAQGDGTQEDLVRTASKEQALPTSPGRAANGWLVPPGDLGALSAALLAALSDAAGLRRMGLESYRIVQEEINLQRMAQAFIEAVMQVRGVAPV
jgi:glycosyltransferase involved in cell wall biosynthesis